jgi:arginine decarboxylase
LIPRSEGESRLAIGQILFVVMARNDSNEPHRMQAAAIGLAIPRDPRTHGYLSEHHSYGQAGREAGDYAEDLVASMLASTLGVESDEQASWDHQREIWNILGEIVTTRSVTRSAVVKPDGRWTTVVAAAVLLVD